jgi:hypothetical protein
MLDEKKSSNVQDTYEFQNWKQIRAISGSLVIKKKYILSVPLYVCICTLFQNDPCFLIFENCSNRLVNIDWRKITLTG